MFQRDSSVYLVILSLTALQIWNFDDPRQVYKQSSLKLVYAGGELKLADDLSKIYAAGASEGVYEVDLRFDAAGTPELEMNRVISTPGFDVQSFTFLNEEDKLLVVE